jgi:hypothetical protein
MGHGVAARGPWHCTGLYGALWRAAGAGQGAPPLKERAKSVEGSPSAGRDLCGGSLRRAERKFGNASLGHGFESPTGLSEKPGGLLRRAA